MHLYGLRTPYKENGLEARVRYPLYIVIYCKRVHYTADSLVWGSLRLVPTIINSLKKVLRLLLGLYDNGDNMIIVISMSLSG